MLLYLIISYLIGLGAFIKIFLEEKKAGVFKKSDLLAYFVVWLFIPIAIPIYLGGYIMKDYKADEDIFHE